MKVILFGATGLVGQGVLRECLLDSDVTEVLSVARSSTADAFLGTQGDPWDTQSDMCLALVGAMCAQVLLARRQDRELAALDAPAAIPHAA